MASWPGACPSRAAAPSACRTWATPSRVRAATTHVGDGVDLQQGAGQGQAADLDQRAGGPALSEILLAYGVDRRAIVHVAHVDHDFDDVGEGGARGVENG